MERDDTDVIYLRGNHDDILESLGGRVCHEDPQPPCAAIS